MYSAATYTPGVAGSWAAMLSSLAASRAAANCLASGVDRDSCAKAELEHTIANNDAASGPSATAFMAPSRHLWCVNGFLPPAANWVKFNICSRITRLDNSGCAFGRDSGGRRQDNEDRKLTITPSRAFVKGSITKPLCTAATFVTRSFVRWAMHYPSAATYFVFGLRGTLA